MSAMHWYIMLKANYVCVPVVAFHSIPSPVRYAKENLIRLKEDQERDPLDIRNVSTIHRERHCQRRNPGNCLIEGHICSVDIHDP